MDDDKLIFKLCYTLERTFDIEGKGIILSNRLKLKLQIISIKLIYGIERLMWLRGKR